MYVRIYVASEEYWMSSLVVIDAFLNWRIELRHVSIHGYIACACVYYVTRTQAILKEGLGS